MMKLKQLVPLMVSLVILLFVRCTDYLDIKNDNRYALATTIKHLQAFLNNNSIMNDRVTPSMTENWADDYFLIPSMYEEGGSIMQNMYIWKIDLYNYQNDWSAAHRPIFNANYCLEGLQKIGRTDENKGQYDRILGEALFYRAYYYQQLVWSFAPVYDEATAKQDVGIVLKMDTDFNTPSIRDNVQNCYAQIINDTKQAIALLPTKVTNPNQPSKEAGYALLARLYLSMRSYELALKYAQLALSIKSDLMDYNNPDDGVSSTQAFSFKKYNSETIFYSEMNGYQGNMYVSGFGGRIDTVLHATYHVNDLRRTIFFNPLENYYEFKGSYALNNLFTGLATDELFLIQAECKVRLNDINGGMQDLNHLLKHRFDHAVPFIALTASDQLNALRIILLERRKELLYRGLRFIDIKRLNKEGFQIAIKRKIREKEYVLDPNIDLVVPIPTDLKSFIK
ncbi:RagB/SusD family nutrient uptake outer membrane protein [Sphingobacterium faecium]|uniref:RagB/SusD family nutrient uptake outer membrane protein n=1 Tax=Sphingobacterium faecium TaxID=34087 RepID=UPI002469B4D3|nr:RagB/SusD family nutrient uptake outer membrane protein [Sphingobacterium faecium]MDH5828723.1 RagB/SusD family nutrient uptake outer membrane protein [Sphingobacterium faecium]